MRLAESGAMSQVTGMARAHVRSTKGRPIDPKEMSAIGLARWLPNDWGGRLAEQPEVAVNGLPAFSG